MESVEDANLSSGNSSSHTRISLSYSLARSPLTSWRWKAAAPSFTRSAASALGKRRVGSGAIRPRQKLINSSLQTTSLGRTCGSRWARNRLASSSSR